MGLCTHRHNIIDLIYGQISFNCCLSNAFKLKLGYNLKIFLVTIKRAAEKDIAKHVIRLAKVIPTRHVQPRCAQLPSLIVYFAMV
jgi:hypothetical protein